MTLAAAPPRGEIGLWAATSFVVGHTIAVGIFLTPAELIGALASPALTIAVWARLRRCWCLPGALTVRRTGRAIPARPADRTSTCAKGGESASRSFTAGSRLLMLDPGVTAALAAGLLGIRGGILAVRRQV